MSNIRPCARLTIDNPDAAGRIATHGFSHDWTFDYVRQNRTDVREQGVMQPQWSLDGCEIIPELNVLTLRPLSINLPMIATDWAILTGSWQFSYSSALTWQWMQYVDARANQYGAMQSTRDFKTDLLVSLVRFTPPPGQTNPIGVDITMRGLTVAYTIELPYRQDEDVFPKLYCNIGAGNVLVDEWQCNDALQLTISDQAQWQDLRIQMVENVLCIRFKGIETPWLYECDYLPQAGPVNICFRGHTGMVNVREASYSSRTATATPTQYLTVPAWMVGSGPQMQVVNSTYPTGATYYGIATGVIDQPNAYQSRPVITLSEGPMQKVPWVYMVHQYHEPVFSAARSEPVTTDNPPNVTNDSKQLLKLSWSRSWPRGWTFNATLRDWTGYWRGKCKENATVKVAAGYDGTFSDIGTFYLSNPEFRREGGVDVQKHELRGEDYFAARLFDKKYMMWPFSPEGTYLTEWVRHWLHRAGVPNALINITADTTSAGLVPATRKRRWQFGHDTPIIQALDEVCREFNKVLTIGTDGRIGLVLDIPGSTAAYTINETTQTADDVIYWAEAGMEWDDYRNYYLLIADDGVQTAIWRDTNSHQTTSYTNYIGDDWWDVQVKADVRNVYGYAAKEYNENLRRRRYLRWETVGQPTIKPGDVIAITTLDNLEIPAGTKFRVIRDSAQIELENEIMFRHTFDCEVLTTT